jgi:hypothetical protein
MLHWVSINAVWVITTGQALAVSGFFFGGHFSHTVHLSWSQHSCNDLVTLLYCSNNNVLPCYDLPSSVKEDPFRGGGRREREIVCFHVMIVNYRILYCLWWDSFIDADPASHIFFQS